MACTNRSEKGGYRKNNIETIFQLAGKKYKCQYLVSYESTMFNFFCIKIVLCKS